MIKHISGKCRHLDRLELNLLICFSTASLVLIPCLIFLAFKGDHFIQWTYEKQLPLFNQLFQNQYPLEHYVALKTKIACHLFVLWIIFSFFSISGLMFIYRFFFSGKTVSPYWLIVVCCTLTSLVYIYNYKFRITSIHTFFRAGPTYQIINGFCPPMDPLFGGEVLHYQWGYIWAAAMISKILNVSPFTSFGIINVLSLAGCLWLLYKISKVLIDDPKINIFSSLFVFYCGTFIHPNILQKIGDLIHLEQVETRIFPLIRKIHNNNGVPLGLLFFLIAVYGTLQLFNNKKAALHAPLILIGTAGCFFLYAAFGPGLLAWFGCLVLFWLTKYNDADFRNFGIKLTIAGVSVFIALLITLPYLKQLSSSGGFLKIQLFDVHNLVQNSYNFLLPSLFSVCIIFIFRNYIKRNLDNKPLYLLGCLFLSNILCYLVFDFSSNVEYKYLLLSLLPFGIISGIAFMQIKNRSKWLALGLFFILIFPSLQLIRYDIESSPRNILEIEHTPPYYESGINLESGDQEENAMYQWIRDNTPRDAYFLDKETKVPVYAQRSLWIAFDTGQKLPGYSMSVPRLRLMHGYDQQEYSQRQQITQNIFGSEKSLTNEAITDYLTKNKLFVIVRNNNARLNSSKLNEVFISKQKKFRILTSTLLETEKP